MYSLPYTAVSTVVYLLEYQNIQKLREKLERIGGKIVHRML